MSLIQTLREAARPDARRVAGHAFGRKNKLGLELLEGREVPATGLGIANDFSAFIIHDVTAYSSDVQGRVAVGGNASFTSYGMGDALSNSHGTRDDLIVGGNLTFKNGQVFNGNVVYGNNGYFESFGHPNGTIRKDNVINFGAAETELETLSNQYAAMAANGSVKNWYGTLTLTGTKTGTNVFHLTAGQLWNANNLIIKAPAGSSVIINVSGTNARMQNMGMSLQGVHRDNVILNFSTATNLRLNGIGVQGNILAPRAFVDFSNGNVNGTLVADRWCGQGQINYTPPVVPPPPICPPPPPVCDPDPPPPPPPPVCPPPPPYCPPPPPVCDPDPPPPPPPACNPPPPKPVCQPVKKFQWGGWFNSSAMKWNWGGYGGHGWRWSR